MKSIIAMHSQLISCVPLRLQIVIGDVVTIQIVDYPKRVIGVRCALYTTTSEELYRACC